MARITEVIADIFDAPEDSVLIREFCAIMILKWKLHTNYKIDACNCQGSWGAGVALAFKERVCYITVVAVFDIVTFL